MNLLIDLLIEFVQLWGFPAGAWVFAIVALVHTSRVEKKLQKMLLEEIELTRKYRADLDMLKGQIEERMRSCS